jgi:uncharacterized protein (DUF1684 family)
MMHHIGLLVISMLSFTSVAQSDYHREIRNYQKEQNLEFANPEESPLTKKGLSEFDSLPFFPIDSTYRVKAYLELTPDSLPFKMVTSTNRLADYRQYAELYFEVRDTTYNMPIYENLRLKKNPAYRDYLFLPFKDLTNGGASYGGGRFMDFTIPEGDTLILDFNKAYNPWCAYNGRYSCPIPPKRNHLPTKIKAGVMKHEGEH